ncbi:N-acetylmuramoyl-L-alanine amidase [Staphylococcus felis]|uniref:N-acetylmuramoyl-L-alanine amidase n=1 Tax=Staphylococcus felis TaxID=46127 RepID=UPI000E270074|nr:N-acetylmuramoyl-L-alanine amidase [Staphylococcus felis]REI06200.1 autolysin [Staphylococcus felis]
MLKIISIFSTFVTFVLASVVVTPAVYAERSLLRPNETESSSNALTRNNPFTPNETTSPLQMTGPFDHMNYPNVNRYIIDNHIKHSKIVKDPRIDTLPKLQYKYGTYIGVIIHEVGQDHRTLQEWVDRMYATYNTAFVHAFVDQNEIRLTAPAEYYVWGAGKQANPYFYQIEVVRTYQFTDFAKSVNNQAWLTAYMLKQKGLEPSLADDNEGVGTVISHDAVRKYWGGTTHVDPIEYYARWGYDMHQFFELVQYHYNQM